MRINLTDERTRLFLSIGSAAIIHIVILILVGSNSRDFSYIPEFGPLTVEISFEKPEVKPIDPEPQDVAAFEEADAPEVETVQPEIQPNPPAPAAETVKTADVAATSPSQARVYTPVKPAAPSTDQSIVESIRRQSSGSTGGVDARSVFGDDPVPAFTDSGTTAAASSSPAGSEVVLSEAESENEAPTVAESTPDEISVLDRSQLSNLDRQLNADRRGGASSMSDSSSTTTEPVAGPVSGNTPDVAFKDSKVKRELETWTEPVIPKDIQSKGISQYIVEIEFDIDSQGVTSGASIIRTSGNTRIDAAVRSALRNWKFAEDLSSEKKVRAVLTYVIKIN